MQSFEPVNALLGGALMGLAANLLLLLNGRVAGMSGIVGGILGANPKDRAWRLMFVAGMLVGAVAAFALLPTRADITVDANAAMLVIAGLLVGYGTRLGNGCTSGHGVCGMARLSPRSMVATLCFMAAGMLSVFLVRHVF